MIEIQTFTCRYDDVEDRIKLIINYEEYEKRVDFMITRSFIIKLLPSIEEFHYKHYNEHIPQLSKPQEKKTTNQIHTKTDNSTLELMKKEPVLLTKIDISYIQEHKSTLLVLTSNSGDAARAVLNKELLDGFLKTLNNAIPKSSWGILGLI